MKSNQNEHLRRFLVALSKVGDEELPGALDEFERGIMALAEDVPVPQVGLPPVPGLPTICRFFARKSVAEARRTMRQLRDTVADDVESMGADPQFVAEFRKGF